MTQSSDQKVQRKHLSSSQWVEAKTLWETGDYRLEDLSERFNVRKETLSRRFKKDGVIKGAKSISENLREAIQSERSDSVLITQQRIRETNEEHYKFDRQLNMLAQKEIITAVQEHQSPAMALPGLKAIEKAMQISRGTMANRRLNLGMDKEDTDDDDLPTLTIRNLTDEMARQIMKNAGQDEELGAMNLSEELDKLVSQ